MDASHPPPDGVDSDPVEDLRTRLNKETAVIAWTELVRHFARGVVITVSADIDLIEAAVSVIEDDAKRMQQLISAEQVVRATDDHARDWTTREPEFWCVVAAPWVLVQERSSVTRTIVH